MIHDATHATVTSVPAGTTVHDQATVTGQLGLPVPTGTVTFSWFTNGTCTAPAAATSARSRWRVGVVDATTFTADAACSPGASRSRRPIRVTAPTPVRPGPCEPLTVTTIASTTATVIHDAAHATVTSVPAGTTVHDQATVTGQPSGDADGDGDVLVVHQRRLHGTGGGDVGPVRAGAAGAVDGTTFTQTPVRRREFRVPGDLFG